MFDFLKRKEESKVKYLHVAIDTKGVEHWCEKNKVSLEDGYLRSMVRIKELLQVQVEQKIPVFSFLILPLDSKKESRTALLKNFKEFIESAFLRTHLIQNKIRVTLLGKWYDLPAELLEGLKKIVEETRYYDNFFLNFCLKYDGQEDFDALDGFRGCRD